jgi:phosphoglucosamine mutase
LAIAFGTDGVRGVANVDLTPEVVLALGRATARVLGAPAFLVARDTRVSSPVLSTALITGLAAEGADVADLGVIPTPALARLAAARHMPAAMISASHNPYPDNGVKVFGAGGLKLSDADEARIASAVDVAVGGPERPPERVGQVREESVGDWYIAEVVASLEGRRQGGARLRVRRGVVRRPRGVP